MSEDIGFPDLSRPESAPSAAANPFDLKVCPWCSGPADFEEIGGKDGAGASFTVGCHDGDGSSVCFGYQSLTQFARKSDAATAWNRRSGPNTQMLEALKAAQEAIVDMEAYSNTPDTKGDLIWRRVRANGAKALRQIMAAINSAESERPEGAFLPDPPCATDS